MNVQLAPELQAEFDKLVGSGHFKNADDAVAQGIRLLLTAEGAYEKVRIGIEQANRGDLGVARQLITAFAVYSDEFRSSIRHGICSGQV